MRRFFLLAICALPLLAADNAAPGMSKVMDEQLKMVESEFVPLAEAMPAEKYGFTPTGGEFKKVRTFGQQVSHVAAVMYACSAAVLGEKNPSEMARERERTGGSDIKRRNRQVPEGRIRLRA